MKSQDERHLTGMARDPDMATQTLTELRSNLSRRRSWLTVKFPLVLTKGVHASSEFLAYVDYELERKVDDIIDSHGGFEYFAKRYGKFDVELSDMTRPKHFPIHLLDAKGQIASGENIFMFFPEVLGIASENGEDYFGLELIDSWTCVFDQIISPCINQIGSIATRAEYLATFCSGRKEVIYLASIFHELGHRVGTWKVSPRRTAGLELTRFQIDILGELSTDTYCVKFLPEFRSIPEFVIYQRLFWFGRMGSKLDPCRGSLNSDNDCWIAAYLWKKCEGVSCLEFSPEGQLRLNHSLIRAVFDAVFDDLKSLSKSVGASTDPSSVVDAWMRHSVPFQDGSFVYPESMRDAFRACANLPTRITKFYGDIDSEVRNDA